MKGRRKFRISLVLATLTGIALAGALIDGAGNSGSKEEKFAVYLSDADLRLVDQNFQQAVLMLHEKQYKAAVQSMHEVLVLRPRMPEAHVNMGYALFGLGDYSAARDFFESATDLRPSQYNGYYGLAIASEELGDLTSAVAAMKAFVHLAPTEDRFRRRAESAIWEWETELAGKEQ